MNRLVLALAAAMFCLAAGISHAQDTNKGQMGGGPHHGMKPCSQEPEPAKCEANRKEMQERMKLAREACKDKPDQRACMTEQMCAKSQDPAKCQAQAKERQAMRSQRGDARQSAAEACAGKRGDVLQKCMHEQRVKSGMGQPEQK